jgi:hypothetical protein
MPYQINKKFFYFIDLLIYLMHFCNRSNLQGAKRPFPNQCFQINLLLLNRPTQFFSSSTSLLLLLMLLFDSTKQRNNAYPPHFQARTPEPPPQKKKCLAKRPPLASIYVQSLANAPIANSL